MKKLLLIAILFIFGGVVFYNTGCRSISCAAEQLLPSNVSSILPGRENIPLLSTTTAAAPAVKSISAPEPLKVIRDALVGSSKLTQTGVIVETNRERTARGIPALSENQKLDAAAEAKVIDMFAKQYFEHVSPSGVGVDTLADRVGYAYVTVGENLALGNFADDQALVTAWMNSPGHRANILNTHFSEIGVAVRKGMFEGREVWLAVQEFGRPLSSCPAIDPTLKQSIEESKTKIEALQTSLDNVRQEIDAMEPKRGDAYNQKVDEYNSLIPSYNQLVAATRTLIDQYNNQVRIFNSCIAN